MKSLLSTRIIDLPEGIKIKEKSRQIEVSGPNGVLFRDFSHILVDMKIEKKKRKLVIKVWQGNKKKIASLNTLSTSISNLITGVLIGFRYEMRLVYAHFPINITIADSGKILEIRNFLGEKKVRRVLMAEGVLCLKNEKVKDEIVIQGNDIDLVSISAASIHRACLVKKKDIRKFLDGIYLYKKSLIN
nr:60S ribosomal protein L9 [Cryptomonas curvata]